MLRPPASATQRMELGELHFIRLTSTGSMESMGKGIQPFYYDSSAERMPAYLVPVAPRSQPRENSSDTDSGFYGDSGSEQSQLSPKQPFDSFPSLPTFHNRCYLRPPTLPKPIARSRSSHLSRVAEHGEWSLGSSSASSSANSSVRSAAPKASLRVRFADQADLPPPPPLAKPSAIPPSYSAHSLGRPEAHGTFRGSPGGVDRSCFYYQTGGSVGVASPKPPRRAGPTTSLGAAPPPYLAAVDRLKEMRLQPQPPPVRLPLQPPPKAKKTPFLSLRNRSASLSRLSQDSKKPSWTIGRSLEDNYASLVRNKSQSFIVPSRSMENIPKALVGHTLSLDTDTIQRRGRAERRSGGVSSVRRLIGRREGRPEAMGLSRSASTSFASRHPPRMYSDLEMESREIAVRVLGVDSDGSKVLVLDKLQPGPFGFYISTGVAKRRKGIFVSRVSAWTLKSHLRVGNELAAIDGVSLAGKSLEEAQALIAHKMAITIAVRPNAHPA